MAASTAEFVREAKGPGGPMLLLVVWLPPMIPPLLGLIEFIFVTGTVFVDVEDVDTACKSPANMPRGCGGGG